MKAKCENCKIEPVYTPIRGQDPHAPTLCFNCYTKLTGLLSTYHDAKKAGWTDDQATQHLIDSMATLQIHTGQSLAHLMETLEAHLIDMGLGPQ